MAHAKGGGECGLTCQSTRTHNSRLRLRRWLLWSGHLHVKQQMPTWLQLTAVAGVVGLFNGAVFLRSAWEEKARRLSPPSFPFGSNSLLAVLAGVLLVKVPLSLTIFLGLPLLPLELLGLLPLYGESYKAYFATYLVAIGAGKATRYAFWKWRLRGQLV